MKKHELFLGLLFIFAAVLIILNQFGFFIGISVFDLVATAVLVLIIFKSTMHRNFFGILFPLAFICILYSDELGINSFTPWPALFTALMLSIGLSILFKPYHNWGGYQDHWHNSFSSNVVNDTDDNVVNCATSFGECIKYVNTDNFQKANLSCSFGEMKVYFDNAQIPSGAADIYLDVSFGSAKLFIPRSWKVICKTNVFLGEMNKNDNLGTGVPVVTIHGNVSFGEAKIIYV
jgi:predicted membrane protein